MYNTATVLVYRLCYSVNLNRGGTRKREPFGFLVCGSSNAHVQSPVWARDVRFLPEASSLLPVCEKQRLWRDYAFAQARLRLY